MFRGVKSNGTARHIVRVLEELKLSLLILETKPGMLSI